MVTIIYSNVLPFLVLLIFLVLVLYNPIFNKEQERYFLVTGVVILAMLVVISLDYLFTASPSFWLGRKMTTFLNFAICPIIPLSLYKIAALQKNSPILYLPFLINIVLCLVSLFNGIIFSVDASNIYERGSLFFVPFITTIVYMLLLISYRGQKHLKGNRFERLFLCGVIVLISIGFILEIVLRFHFLSWTAAALCLPMYYVLLNINHAILDPLTGCYNRLVYTKDIGRISNRTACVMALLDINDFKIVNDTLGHDAGDQHLIRFANTINQHLFFCSLYRIGGDEFVVLTKKETIARVNDNLERARKELETHNIKFSYGIDEYNPTEDIGAFLNKIDQLMYDNKKNDKAR